MDRMSAQHIGWVIYALASLEMEDSRALLEEAVGRAGELLHAQLGGSSRRGGRSGRGRSAAGLQGGRVSDSMTQQQQRQGPGSDRAEAGVEGEVFVAADYAGMVWGLGTLRYRPSEAWLDALCRCGPGWE